jgi:hypothetical protein
MPKRKRTKGQSMVDRIQYEGNIVRNIDEILLVGHKTTINETVKHTNVYFVMCFWF